MRLHRLIVAFAFVTSIALVPVSAQTKPTRQPPPSQTGGAVPDSKIALIYSEAFLDSKGGIGRFGTLLTTLNKEFEKTQSDIKSLEQRIAQLQDEITKAQAAASVVDPKSLQAKADQLDQLKKDYQRRGEDAQALYNKRRTEIFQPLQEDI